MKKTKKARAIIMAATLMIGTSITSFAATAQDVINLNPTSYTAGTSSVYGPALSQDQLNAVAQAVADFKTNYINDSMDNDTKIKTAYDYMKNNVTYIDWRESDYANTAYGALVEKRAACSGMTRAFVAMMDAVGVKAYWIHAVGNDHQWNLVEFNDGFYFIDIDANIASGFDWIYHAATHPYSYDSASYPAIGSKSGQSTSGTQTVSEGWDKDSIGWWWRNADGSYPTNTWKQINGAWYYFEGSGYMAANKWIDGMYYVGSDGAMLTNTTTPDGYKVDANGVWIHGEGQTGQKNNAVAENTEEIQSVNSDNPFIPKYTYSLKMSDPNFETTIKFGEGVYYKVKKDGQYLTNQWVMVYQEGNSWTAYLYLDDNGLSLKGNSSKDGFAISSSGFYIPPAYNPETGRRGFIVGDSITYDLNIEPLEERVDTNGNTYYLLDPNTTSISFLDDGVHDPSCLDIDFAAYRYNPSTNTIYAFSNDGTAIYEDFEFGKVYDFKITNVNLSGAALVEYCKQNDILIRVDVNDNSSDLGISFLFCYE